MPNVIAAVVHPRTYLRYNATMNAVPKHRLCWYQYSLRSLFVLTVLVAIGGSWFAVKRQQKERERAAVNWVEEKGVQ